MAFQDFNAAGFLRCLSAFYSDLYFALRSRLGYLSVKLKLNICYDREEQNMNLSNTLWSMDLAITAPGSMARAVFAALLLILSHIEDS